VSDRNYCIKENYVHRAVPDFDDERGRTDEMQDQVYRTAAGLPEAPKVMDIGCGGGFKLLKYFRDRYTIGVDLPPTVEWLRREYPDRAWATWDNWLTLEKPDLIISADVIEHLPDPDVLLHFIAKCNPKWIVLSTPDRDRLQAMFHDGPPKNLCHCREWTAPEFREYVSSRFVVVDHYIPVGDDSTQYIIAKPKPSAD
jgi:2-polyprenyl-3-methyl-5-hydroxy-6-metoxy-1,4-benzoquinol methylase